MSFTSRELSKADESQMLVGLWNGIGRRGWQVRNEIESVCSWKDEIRQWRGRVV